MSNPATPPLTRRERRARDRAERRPPAETASRAAWRSPFVLVTIGALVVMAALIGGLVLTSQRSSSAPAEILIEPPATNLDQYADGAALGPSDAPVVLEVYVDYQCPFCGRFARENLPGLVSRFVSTGQLRIEERTIAFLGTTTPDESLDAATAAACAAPAGKYWSFANYLFWNQSGENEGAFSRARLAAMADRVGLDAQAFDTCLNDAAERDAVQARTADAFSAGIRSTPTFVVDGEVVTLNSFAELSSIIQARVDVASGS